MDVSWCSVRVTGGDSGPRLDQYMRCDVLRKHYSSRVRKSRVAPFLTQRSLRLRQSRANPKASRVRVHFAAGFLSGTRETWLALFCQRDLVSSHVQKQRRCWFEGGLSFMVEKNTKGMLKWRRAVWGSWLKTLKWYFRMIRAPSRGRPTQQ